MSDYLWDRSGAPDPEIKELEQTLAPLRYQPGPLRLPQPKAPVKALFWPRAPVKALSLAAAALLLAVGGWLLLRALRQDPSSPKAPEIAANPPTRERSFAVTRLAGAPEVGSSRITETGALAKGQWLKTDARSRARIEVAEIGQVEVAPESQVRLVETSDTLHRLELSQGEIKARVNAPPRLFVVDTPAATAVDLGCEYRLVVDEAGNGRLEVSSGYVALEAPRKNVIVPAGAACGISEEEGPGVPYFINAPAELQTALFALEAGGGAEEDLKTIFLYAQPPDSLSLWHLLPRVDSKKREAIFDWLVKLAPLPEGASREAVLRLEKDALKTWRKSFLAFW